MALAGVAFVGYGLAFLGSGFEIGVATLNGVIRADLNAIDPGIVHYITHLHVATAAFIIATGIALAKLAWYGVRSGQSWAWVTAVVTAVAGLDIALPMHYADLFAPDWVTHLGPSTSRRSCSWWAPPSRAGVSGPTPRRSSTRIPGSSNRPDFIRRVASTGGQAVPSRLVTGFHRLQAGQ